MKKIILTLAIAVSSLAAFATEESVSKNVLNSFNKEFTGAREVKWTVSTDYYRAAFLFNDQYITAFYDKNGDLMAMTRNISLLNLPLKLQTELRSDYADYWISDLFELSNADGTHYYITVEKAESKVVLRSESNTEWQVFKKMSKV